MKKLILGTFVVAILAATFFSGYWYSKRPTTGAELGRQRAILYYIDPMNPGNRYDQPGIAPCGMALEPVYGGGSGGTAGMPPGTVRITPEKQQLIGIRLEGVERRPLSYSLRLLGRVAADETRTFPITSSVEGLVRRVHPFTTGSLVKKGQALASIYAADFLAVQQTYLFALNSTNLRSTVRIAGIATNVSEQSTKQIADNLRFLGMGETQLKELGQSREFIEDVDIEAPATGLVVARNIWPGLRFDKGAEFYRIVDLREVWIVVDAYGREAAYFRPGDKVPVRYQGITLEAKVSDVLPQFDAATRTMKVRLIAANPDYLLRPDMFVSAEYPVAMPPALTVPMDAVLDSGKRKTVYVDRDNGFFEPRPVVTGRTFGDRVEITKGLMAGDRVVVSGNFLLDSESRFKAPAPEAAEPPKDAEATKAAEAVETADTKSIDPICGMEIDRQEAVAAGLTSERGGKTHFFCSTLCKEKFDGASASPPLAEVGRPVETDHMEIPEHHHGEAMEPGPAGGTGSVPKTMAMPEGHGHGGGAPAGMAEEPHGEGMVGAAVMGMGGAGGAAPDGHPMRQEGEAKTGPSQAAPLEGGGHAHD